MYDDEDKPTAEAEIAYSAAVQRYPRMRGDYGAYRYFDMRQRQRDFEDGAEWQRSQPGSLVTSMVSSVEELDALPVRTIVLTDGDVYSKLPSGMWKCLDDAIGIREWSKYSSHTVISQTSPQSARVLFIPDTEIVGND